MFIWVWWRSGDQTLFRKARVDETFSCRSSAATIEFDLTRLSYASSTHCANTWLNVSASSEATTREEDRITVDPIFVPSRYGRFPHSSDIGMFALLRIAISQILILGLIATAYLFGTDGHSLKF